MGDMPGMGHLSALSPLSWGSFFSTWSLKPAWLIAVLVLAGAYLLARTRAGERSTVAPWRVASFLGGLAVMWVAVASAIGGYAMAVFWMHMVLHLVLIMVVPALLVLGHPITVLVESLSPSGQRRALRVLHSLPFALLTHWATGLVVYSAVIIYTHLGDFMDRMAMSHWLMNGEQVAYVVAGYLLLLPLIGEEPIRARPPYLLRMVVLVAAMIPDTIVGIVLLQTSTVPFPMMMRMHPSWAPNHLSDVHAAGGLMWAAGDGLMMTIAVGLVLAVVTSPARRDQMTGAWLESARRSALLEHVASSGAEAPRTEDGQVLDTDGDEALDAYNRMLARLQQHEADR